MYPSDKRPRLYTSGAAKKREKKRRLDNAVAGTRKIRSFLPAPEDEAAAEPTTAEPTTAEPATEERTSAEPARCGPVVRELDLTLDNKIDRALFQLGTLPTELRTTIIHHGPCRPKGPFAISSDNGNRRLFSDKNTPMHILGQWK